MTVGDDRLWASYFGLLPTLEPTVYPSHTLYFLLRVGTSEVASEPDPKNPNRNLNRSSKISKRVLN